MEEFNNQKYHEQVRKSLHDFLCEIPMTMERLAEDSGLSKQTVINILKGKKVTDRTLRIMEGYIKFKSKT